MTSRRGLFKIGSGMKGLPQFYKRFSHHWEGWSRDKETKRAARNYLMGIILPGKRKNMSRVSRRVRLEPNVTQQFITDSPWDPSKVMATNVRTMSGKVASEEGVIIVDDTGQEKKGKKSPGVSRQYSGTLGKRGNCQVFVASWYCTPGETRNADAAYWPTGMGLYIPEEWFEDKGRCKQVGIPDNVKFQTKPEIALELIDRVRKIVPHRAITADTAYGINGKFRSVLREWKEPYAVAVTPSDISVVPEDTPIIPAGTKAGRGRPQIYPRFPKDIKPKTADVLAPEIPDKDWEEVVWSEGTKGKLSARFTRVRVRVAKNGRATDETGWLLLEKTKDGELKTYMCWGLDEAPLEELVKIAHIRWVVEQGFKQMKGELGLDDFEGRKWIGWHHHAAMVMIAFCYLMLLRIEGNPSGNKLPTLPQVRKELARIFIRRIYELKFNLSSEEADEFLEEYPVLIPE